MQRITLENDYFGSIIKLRFHSSVKRLKFHINFIFKDIDFKDKNVLDIGGGIWIHSFYAAYMGAKSNVCLEPELAGISKKLKENRATQKEYKKYFLKLFYMTSSGSKLIICDCSNKTFLIW